MKKKHQTTTIHNIRVTPEFRDEPDIEKLGRVLISVAMSIMEKKKADQDTSPEERHSA